MNVTKLLLLVFIILIVWPINIAMADDPTTAQFIKDCQSGSDACKDLLSEDIMDSDPGPACIPNIDLVIAELRAHPEWATLSWVKGVDQAIRNICSRSR